MTTVKGIDVTEVGNQKFLVSVNGGSGISYKLNRATAKCKTRGATITRTGQGATVYIQFPLPGTIKGKYEMKQITAELLADYISKQ